MDNLNLGVLEGPSTVKRESFELAGRDLEMKSVKDMQSSPPTFVVVGSANMDLIVKVPRLPRSHEKVRAEYSTFALGGAGANTASWLARLGRRVALVTAVGSDPLADQIVSGLISAGVDTQWIDRSPSAPTGIAVVFSRKTEKRMVTTGGPSRTAVIDLLPAEMFSEGVHLHVIGDASPAVVSLCRRAAARGASVSAESNGRDLHPIAKYLDVILLNSDELRRLVGKEPVPLVERARELLVRPGAWIVVTRGGRGAMAVSHDSVLRVPAVPTDVVDRTGAGDAFDAGFLDQWTRSRDVERALVDGVRLASNALRQTGAQPGGSRVQDGAR